MTEIIAEIASNAGGHRAVAERLIAACASSLVDTVKFQSVSPSHLSTDDPQRSWLSQAEWSRADHLKLLNACQKSGVRFLTTVFHPDRVRMLAELGLSRIKIGSGEVPDTDLLAAVARYPWTVVLSTGLCTLAELDAAVELFAGRVSLLHCVSQYPTPTAAVNWPRVAWLRDRYHVPVGFSDHTIGNDAALLALADGVDLLEMHVSDADCPRTSAWDKTPADLAQLTTFREAVQMMRRLRPMMPAKADRRPYVGRWRRV